MTSPLTTLQLPSFLHGSYLAIETAAKAEGRRCGQEFKTHGVFPPTGELRTIVPGDVVFTHNVVDFDDTQPAWRLYMVSEIIMSVCKADTKDWRRLAVQYEASLRRTAWGALYCAISGDAPESAERMALRVEALLNAWPSLQHGRYAHKQLGTYLNLEELLTTAIGWVLEAWCPEASGPLPSRFALASERMARATKAECVEAILRRLPPILAFAHRTKLQHPEVVMDIASWREHLATLDAADFERVSGVCPAEVLGAMYQWDRRLNVQ